MPGEINISTSKRNELIDITPKVEEFAKGIDEGIVHVYVPHTSAGITINENADPSVREDILRKLSELVPENGNYRHSEGNADSHIKATIVGSSVSVPVKDGKLMLGTWQGIFFCEFDGPRKRKIFTTSLKN